eukprot:TRINITY_DN35916_c0_g1_i1.p1 TRINITY_DN35916_c0_g1~~TRINITY_DN35916_c0_g1_i1.p1  ORF type:complete len:276 (-),score=19.62 TRINITY_DN35916_c0_g1_i1:77-904(-)
MYCTKLIPRHEASSMGRETANIIKQGWYINPLKKKVFIEKDVALAKERVSYFEASERILTVEPTQREGTTTVSIRWSGTLEAAKDLEESTETQPFILNFASSKTPGGGFLHGSRAQEESLARSSALYATLMTPTAQSYYQTNKFNPNAFGSDGIIVSQDVPTFRHSNGQLLDYPYLATYITCAAPFVRHNTNQARLAEAIDNRIGRIIDAALHFGAKNIVLGAWGCGAFHCPSSMVAASFKKHVDRATSLDQVIYAINDKHLCKEFADILRCEVE